MGTLSLPSQGLIYIDTAPLIYSVEQHPDYGNLLAPLWEASEAGQIQVVASQLLLLEVLTGVLKRNDAELLSDYERVLTASELNLVPISASILREAAHLRATMNLKTPDAIHAATALTVGCVQFITNDFEFRRLSQLNVVILKELI
ncbi:MAG: type II toxin-antitoxin system VapC family toxin [Acidobacteria bacterium]|nr:type II toxin-antitoxin system VapC family toxin [Acidobacteriota bacterium]